MRSRERVEFAAALMWVSFVLILMVGLALTFSFAA